MDNTITQPNTQPIQPQGKLSVDDFATKIKTKFPQYSKIDNAKLTNDIIAKHPEYRDKVDLTPKEVPDISLWGQSTSKTLGNIAHDVGSRLGKVFDTAGQEGDSTLEKVAKPFETQAQGASQALGLATDVAGEAFKWLTPNFIKDAMGTTAHEIISTPTGQKALKAFQQGQEAYSKFEQEHPHAAVYTDLLGNAANAALTFGTEGLGGAAEGTAKTGIAGALQKGVGTTIADIAKGAISKLGESGIGQEAKGGLEAIGKTAQEAKTGLAEKIPTFGSDAEGVHVKLSKNYNDIFEATATGKKALGKIETKLGTKGEEFNAGDFLSGKSFEHKQPLIEVKGSNLDTTKGVQLLENDKKAIDTHLANEIKKVSTKVGKTIKLSDLESKVLSRSFKGTSSEKVALKKQVEQEFKDMKSEYGDNIDLSTLNSIKSDQWAAAKKFENVSKDTNYHIGNTLKTEIENIANKEGFADVAKINAESGRHAEMIKYLSEKINGKTVNRGKLGKYVVEGLLGSAGLERGGLIGGAMGVLGGKLLHEAIAQLEVSNPIMNRILKVSDTKLFTPEVLKNIDGIGNNEIKEIAKESGKTVGMIKKGVETLKKLPENKRKQLIEVLEKGALPAGEQGLNEQDNTSYNNG